MRNPEELKKKRDSLLQSLFEADIITAETYRLAVAEPVPTGQLPFPLAAPHFGGEACPKLWEECTPHW